jgi:DNA-binding transcriptional ArsR family regulator
MFDALSDTSRLKTLMLLPGKDLSVSEIAAAEGEKMTTVSARLQILHAARLIARRRKGKSVIYSIADNHVLTLVENAIAHAGERY